MEPDKIKGAIFNEIIIENTTPSIFYLSLPVSLRLLEQARYSFVLKSVWWERKVLFYDWQNPFAARDLLEY